MRIKGTRRAIALTTDGSGHYCYLDPYAGGAIAVAEAARNVVCVGAEPIAVTDCLNFGNPERPEVYYQMEGVISGMAEACRALNTPVISGNVSLYNETNASTEASVSSAEPLAEVGGAVWPTPVVGMLGLLEDVDRRCGMGFLREGDRAFLLGAGLEAPVETLGGSDYVRELHGRLAGRPHIDLALEVRVQRACLEAIREGLVRSAHDCSHGGLAVALAESCIAGGMGLDGSAEASVSSAEPLAEVASQAQITGRVDAALFGEAQSRIVVSAASEREERLRELARAHDVPLTPLGTVGGSRLRIGPHGDPRSVDVSLADLSQAYEEGLPRALQSPPA
jgi:phosphoribosylformylglycinamidine synthase